MDKKYFAFKGCPKLQNKNSKYSKLAPFRQISNDISAEQRVETVQRNAVSPKLSRLEKLRAYREDKDLKKKMQLKIKRPPFKPSGSTQPRSTDTSPVPEGQIKIPKLSFIPRIGSLKPPSIFVKKRTPKDSKQNNEQKVIVKANSFISKIAKYKESSAARIESLSPGFPSDISCIEPVKDISFAPIEFTFSGVENVDQFEFMPVSALQSFPETVIARRSTPIKTTPVYSSLRQRAADANVSSQKSFTKQKLKPVSLENAKRISTPRSLVAKPSEPSANSNDVKIKSENKKQSVPSLKSAVNSSTMSRSSELSSTLLKSGKGKPLPEHRIACTRHNRQDKFSLLGSSKASQDNGKDSSGSTKQKKEFEHTKRLISSKISQQGKINSSESFKHKRESGHTTQIISSKISQQETKNSSLKHMKEFGHTAQVISSKISQQINKNASGSFKHKNESGHTTQVISSKTWQRAKASDTGKNKHDTIEHRTSINLQRNSSLKNEARPFSLKLKKDHEIHKNADKKIIIKKKNAFEDKCEDDGDAVTEDKNKMIIQSQDKDDSDAQFVSFKENQNEDERKIVIKSVTPGNSKNKVNDKTVIKPVSFENDSKTVEKFLSPEEIGSGDVLINWASFEGRDDETVIELVSYEDNKSEEDEAIMIWFVSPENDKEEMKSIAPVENAEEEMKSIAPVENAEELKIKPVLLDIHEQATVLLCKESSNDKCSELSVFEKYKCKDIEEAMIPSFDESKQLDIENTKLNLLTDEVLTESSSDQKCEKEYETALLHKTCNTCTKLICFCFLDEPSPNEASVALTEVTSGDLLLNDIVCKSDNSLDNHKNDIVVENVHFNVSGKEVRDAVQCNKLVSNFSNATLNVSDCKLDGRSERFQHDNSLMKNEILSKVFHQNSIMDRSYTRSAIGTPLKSIVNTISRQESSRKMHPHLKQTLSDENTSMSQEFFDMYEKMNHLHISSSLPDFSFIENEEMPMVNLEAFDNTLDISAFTEARSTPKAGNGIKFYHFQELEDTASPNCHCIPITTPLKKLPGCIAVSEQSSTLHTCSEVERKQNPFDSSLSNDSLLGNASKQAEDSVLEVSTANLCELSDLVDENAEDNDVPLSSVSLLYTPQIPKPLSVRPNLNDDLITFSPFVKF